jgi:hypothetical protein
MLWYNNTHLKLRRHSCSIMYSKCKEEEAGTTPMSKEPEKKKLLSSDKDYASIFGVGGGLDWTGEQGHPGPTETVSGAAPKFGRNY